MRGKVVLSSENPLCRGITPAYAGKSWTAAAQTSACWDHPRVCGEKMVSMIPHRRSRGSPPRVRGKEWYLQGESPAPGITPAYAGKSGWRSCCPGCNRYHPRVCGEKSQPAVRRSCAKGSPPRVRGKGVQSCNERVAVGITPAYAGKSWGRARTSSRRRDHPRVCGEKNNTAKTYSNMEGSPPRMRGKVHHKRGCRVFAGITPACAGKSARRQAGPPGPAPPPQMRLGWSPPPCTGRQCRTRKSTHARRARIPAPAHTPAPQ